MEIPITAYGVDPTCRWISISDIDINATLEGGVDIGNQINFTGRGCEVDHHLSWPLSTAQQVYSYTSYQSYSADADPQDRVRTLAGVHDNNTSALISNFTVLSCFPMYYQASANLTVAVDNSGPTQHVESGSNGDSKT